MSDKKEEIVRVLGRNSEDRSFREFNFGQFYLSIKRKIAFLKKREKEMKISLSLLKHFEQQFETSINTVKDYFEDKYTIGEDAYADFFLKKEYMGYLDVSWFTVNRTPAFSFKWVKPLKRTSLFSL